MNQYHILYRENEREKLLAWWKTLEDNRGERAVLRRTSCVDDVLLTPAFARFLAMMPSGWSESYRLFDSAMVAGLLARVKTNEKDKKKTFATALAMPGKQGCKAVMSGLRFQQLQKSRDVDEFFLRMSRAIALLGGQVNLLSMADGVLHWLKEHLQTVDKIPHKRLAVRWANDYYTQLKD
ncbi:MAG: type I-E CRISPR-associated protein Cse2/CasB [Spongiibacteraceae bacterium]|nr:type I-E CRISPR-associated protein Cse2/CasB [Spongiibacteraceae bacterium]